MKVMLYGSTQSQHVKKMLENNGIEVVGPPDYRPYKLKLTKLIIYIKFIRDIDFIYRIGTPKFDISILLGKLAGKKTVTHWIGSDVLLEKKNIRSISSKIRRMVTDFNLAGSPLLKEELNEIGINSCEIPIVPSKTFTDVCLMPIKHSVLAYIPEGKESFYGMDYIKYFALKYPQIVFHIVANSKDNLSMQNVIFHGKLSLDEMNELYEKITILFRFPEHDGLSMMLLEALSKGKYVIYPYEFPYVYTPKSRNFDEVEVCFKNILNIQPTVNYEASAYIHSMYNEERIYKLYEEIIKTI